MQRPFAAGDLSFGIGMTFGILILFIGIIFGYAVGQSFLWILLLYMLQPLLFTLF